MKPKRLTKAERKRLEALDARPGWKPTMAATPKVASRGKGTGNRTGNDFRSTTGGVRGAESVVNGFHPSEVARARKLMPSVAHMIGNDGSVRFKNRKEERKFVREQQTGLARAHAVALRHAGL